MRTLLQSAAVLLLLVLSGGTAVVVYGVHNVLGRAQASLTHVDVVIQKAEKEWQYEAPQVHSIVARTADAASEAALFASEQRAQLRKTSADSDEQVRNLGLVTRNAETFFYHLDQNLNGKILPDFDSELKATSMAAQFSMESLTHAGDALTFQLQDPEIAQTIHGLNMSAASLASFSVKSDAFMGYASDSMFHVDHTFAYYDKQLTTPLGFWKTLGKTLLTTGSEAGNIYGGFFRPAPKP